MVGFLVIVVTPYHWIPWQTGDKLLGFCVALPVLFWFWSWHVSLLLWSGNRKCQPVWGWVVDVVCQSILLPRWFWDLLPWIKGTQEWQFVLLMMWEKTERCEFDPQFVTSCPCSIWLSPLCFCFHPCWIWVTHMGVIWLVDWVFILPWSPGSFWLLCNWAMCLVQPSFPMCVQKLLLSLSGSLISIHNRVHFS